MRLDNIRISQHCKIRFLQRGSLLLFPEEKRHPYDAIKRMLYTGYKNMRLESVPFYKNKLGCTMVTNGRFKFYIRNNTVVTCAVNKKDDEWRY